MFSALGSRVTVVHRGDRMLRHEDAEISTRFTESFGEQVDLRLHTTACAVRHDTDGVHARARRARATLGQHPGDGSKELLHGDVLLVTTGRIPNGAQLEVGATGVELDEDGYVVTDPQLRTTAPGVWALGDIRNPQQLKHLANQEARVVSHNLLHPDDPITDPPGRDAARGVRPSRRSGRSARPRSMLQRRATPFVTGRCDYGGVAYGWALEDTTGFAKILIDPTDLQILGGHVVGPQAATLVQQMAQAMTFKIPADRLAREQIWCAPGAARAAGERPARRDRAGRRRADLRPVVSAGRGVPGRVG